MYGLRGKSLNLIRSYLENRQQCAKIKYALSDGECFSDYRSIDAGVPQGSVHESLLFTVYINDFPNVSTNFKSILFADDTTLVAAGSNFNSLVDELTVELDKVSAWSHANKLAPNSNKTSAMIFSNRFSDVDIDRRLNVNFVSVDYSDCHKFLGILVDNKLKFKNHIELICNKFIQICWYYL